MLSKPSVEQKDGSNQVLHANKSSSQDKLSDSQHIGKSINALFASLIEISTRIKEPSELYKKHAISANSLLRYDWTMAMLAHKQLFAKTSLLKSTRSNPHRTRITHIYFNVFERLLFELNLFHIFFAYDVGVDNHSPWDNLNPSSMFLLCGNLQKMYQQTQPTDAEIQYFFNKVQRYVPLVRYKCFNTERWKTSLFEDANQDINNDYHYVARVLHGHLFDTSVACTDDSKEQAQQQQQQQQANGHSHSSNGHIKQDMHVALENNNLEYKLLLVDKTKPTLSALTTESDYDAIDEAELICVHRGVVENIFDVASNEELSRNMITPSMYLKSGHALGARIWIPDSDLYGNIMIKCHATIMLEKGSYISSNGAGYTSHYGKGHGLYWKQPSPNNLGSKFFSGGGYGSKGADAHPAHALGGKTYGHAAMAKELHFGSPSGGRERGGGVIELIAENVINYGKISCDGDNGKQFGGGSGGSIKIVCKKFVNCGKITAVGGKACVYQKQIDAHTVSMRVGGNGGVGRIAIYCEQFVNQGSIVPEPYVQKNFKYNDDFQFTALALAQENMFTL